LCVVLIFNTQRTTKKGIELYRKERTLIVQPFESSVEVKEIVEKDQSSMKEIEAILKVEKKRFPIKFMLIFVLVLIIVTLSSLLKGKNQGTSVVGIHGCSPGYWVITFGTILILIAMTFFIGIYLMKQYQKKEIVNFPFEEGDIRWTKKQTTLTGVAGFFAGVLASWLGIGGGMILSPLMLEFKVPPDVTAATSSFMILFTSLSSIIQFIVLGTMIGDYGGWFAFLGLLSSWVGQVVILLLIKKYHRKSPIIFSISIVIGLSTLLLFVTGIMNIVNEVKFHKSIGFRAFC